MVLKVGLELQESSLEESQCSSYQYEDKDNDIKKRVIGIKEIILQITVCAVRRQLPFPSMLSKFF